MGVRFGAFFALEEKSISSTIGKLYYTHPRIRAAYRSLRTNFPYLLPIKNISAYQFQILQMHSKAECSHT